MYITKVVSYNRVWEKLITKYESKFQEIEFIFNSNDEISFP
jgi:hypothetical protein